MRKDREKALVLRLQGHSYNEIGRMLGIPKATLSNWFSGLVLPEEAQARIKKRTREGSLKGLIKKNKLQTHQAWQRATTIRKAAKSEITRISKKDLLLIGAALYWAEGYKKLVVKDGKERTHHKISFSNTDPIMIRLFIQFLSDVLEISKSKIYASVRIFEHMNEKEALRYWQRTTGLPRENFQKFYYGVSRSSMGKRPYNRLPYGTIQIIVGDTKNFHKIMGWIEGLGKYFI